MRNVPSWGTYYMNLAHQVATRSKDPRTQVGCVLVNRDMSPISFGYNGFPSGIIETAERWDGVEKYKYVVHAEVNAILNAARNGVSTKNAIAYITLFPCGHCALQLVQSGIKGIYYDVAAQRARMEERPEFAEGFQFAANILNEGMVSFHGL